MMMMTMMMTIMMMFKTTMHPVVGILVSRTLSREKGSAADSRDLITFQFELKKHLDFIVIAIAIFVYLCVLPFVFVHFYLCVFVRRFNFEREIRG